MINLLCESNALNRILAFCSIFDTSKYQISKKIPFSKDIFPMREVHRKEMKWLIIIWVVYYTCSIIEECIFRQLFLNYIFIYQSSKINLLMVTKALFELTLWSFDLLFVVLCYHLYLRLGQTRNIMWWTISLILVALLCLDETIRSTFANCVLNA